MWTKYQEVIVHRKAGAKKVRSVTDQTGDKTGDQTVIMTMTEAHGEREGLARTATSELNRRAQDGRKRPSARGGRAAAAGRTPRLGRGGQQRATEGSSMEDDNDDDDSDEDEDYEGSRG